MRHSILVSFCILSCIAAMAGATTIDRVSPEVVSAQIVVAPDQADFQQEAELRRALYRELVGRAAEHAMVDLGGLRAKEIAHLSEANQAESRRLLVGIDRVVNQEVDRAAAIEVAQSVARLHGVSAAVPTLSVIDKTGGQPLFFIVELDPVGFVVVAGHRDLPPVIGYSLQDSFPLRLSERDVLLDLLHADLVRRSDRLPGLPPDRVEANHRRWAFLLDGETDAVHGPQYWPPAGSTPTGGWLQENWHQSAPYNDQCPMDPVAGGRSVAGCPAVAMALIIDYNRNTNGTALDDSDDYYHSYAGRQYWIDDDWQTTGFPSFPDLSASLAALNSRYAQGTPATDSDAAALVFACGAAAHQVFTSSVSGTFGVAQAVTAYTRFGVEGFELLDGTEPDFHQRLSDNMKNARPAHLAVVDAAGSSGHNLVIDGTNTDGYYHLNFGWGGSANGWYLIPDEIPYGLTVIEGVIVDIAVPLFSDGFEDGTTDGWSINSP